MADRDNLNIPPLAPFNPLTFFDGGVGAAAVDYFRDSGALKIAHKWGFVPWATPSTLLARR